MRQVWGRDTELSRLISTLERKTHKVIWITGPSGMGKTSLAHEVLRASADTTFNRVFSVRATVVCYMADWSQTVIRTARQMEVQFLPRLSVNELEQKILRQAGQQEMLLLLDDVDSVLGNPADGQSLVGFVRRWAQSAQRSVLMLTSRQIPPESHEASEPIRVCTLEGLTQPEAIEALLGEDLVRLIKEQDEILKLASRLGGTPQRLLYVRWRSPRTMDELKRVIEELQASGPGGGAAAVEAVLTKIPHPLTHFLALGRLREPRMEEPFLAFLWDRLGGGSTEVYVRVLQLLLEQNLLSIEDGSGKRILRLSAGVHLGLEKALLASAWGERARYIDHFISEYYRNQFAQADEEQPALDMLRDYVEYALRCGDFDAAYKYVFESDLLERFHNQGRSLELQQVLVQFERHLDELGTKSRGQKTLVECLADPKNAVLAERAARVKIEMGRVHNDLSRHPECLECMKNAMGPLDTPAGREIPRDVHEALLMKAYHFSAISNSDLGRTIDCITNYSHIMANALQKGSLTPFGALVMGYLAHEIMFHDMDKSLEWGRLALRWSQECQSPVNCIKNLCSLGQTLLFSGQLPEAEKCLGEARAECMKLSTRGDLRELGRVLVSSAAVCIACQQWSQAKEDLKEGLKLNRQFGDRRRAATAGAYLAIVQFRRGDRQPGAEGMLEAIRQHREIEDWRNLVGEVLTYVWMNNQIFNGDFSQIPAQPLPGEILGACNHVAAHPELQIFVRFWREHFKPFLLGS